MSNEQTSVLSFGDLILEVAFKLGLAYYGTSGEDEPQIPIDKHDLILCKRIVNKAIRMFIHDAPKNGWSWLDIVAQTDLWPQISSDPNVATGVRATYSASTNRSRLNLFQPAAGTAAFYPSMEYRQIWLAGNPPPATDGFSVPVNGNDDSRTGTAFSVVNWISATQIEVSGDATVIPLITTTGESYSFASTGDYTLPANFGGQYTGEITYKANTNRGMIMRWTSEAAIRGRRQNYNIESGTPYEAAIRQIPQPTLDELDEVPRRGRWELMTWRISSEYLHVLFPYTLHFNDLVNLNDLQPAPFGHDETIKAACLGVAEKEVNDTLGLDWQYYTQTCLPNSYRVDANSRPRNLGYFGNPTANGGKFPAIKTFRDYFYQRPNVPVY